MSTTTPAPAGSRKTTLERVAEETGVSIDAVRAAVELEGADKRSLAAVRQAVRRTYSPSAPARRAAASRPAKPQAQGAGERGPRDGSTLHAVLTVLRRARGPLKPAEVYDRIKEGNLAPGLKGKTPEATVAAQMAVAAAKGKHGIYRPEPGRYTVRKES